jgi:hypothetical protein
MVFFTLIVDISFVFQECHTFSPTTQKQLNKIMCVTKQSTKIKVASSKSKTKHKSKLFYSFREKYYSNIFCFVQKERQTDRETDRQIEKVKERMKERGREGGRKRERERGGKRERERERERERASKSCS